MIRLGKDKTLDNYFINENGVITDENGEVQETKVNIYEYFKGIKVHQIQMWTNFEWRDTKIWAIHHLDENKLNNSLNNLVYLTHSEHTSLHDKGNQNNLGKHLSVEHKRKISEKLKGENHPFYGKHHSEESKEKMRSSQLGHTVSEETKIKIGLGHKGRSRNEETKRKISESLKGINTWTKCLYWFNDGVKNYRCKECPPNCIKGKLSKINRLKMD